jgi:hypothetical protein
MAKPLPLHTFRHGPFQIFFVPSSSESLGKYATREAETPTGPASN